DQFMIVADGRARPFDGDLDDYRDLLFEKEKPVRETKPKSVERPKAQNRKPLESRIKRIEELMARLNARKAEIEARLADPAAYAPGNAGAVRDLLSDQAYVGGELAQLEAEWLEKQAELEGP